MIKYLLHRSYDVYLVLCNILATSLFFYVWLVFFTDTHNVHITTPQSVIRNMHTLQYIPAPTESTLPPPRFEPGKTRL